MKRRQAALYYSHNEQSRVPLHCTGNWQMEMFNKQGVLCKTSDVLSLWTPSLRHECAAAWLLGLWVPIPPGDMDVCFLWVLCAVRQRVWVKLITCPEQSYRVSCLSVIIKPRPWGGHGPLPAVASWKKKGVMNQHMVNCLLL